MKGAFAARLFCRAVAAAVLLGLAGCATDRPKPAPLQEFKPALAAREAWRHDLGSLAFPMQAQLRDGMLVVASEDGTVRALDVLSGRVAWEARVGARLSAGVGSDGRWSAVVTRDNELITLLEGRIVWRTRLAARTVTPPLVAGERVFVMPVNRVVQAFDAADGKRLWNLDRPGDALTLGLPGVLAAFKNTLLVGQGPRLAGVDPSRGTIRWEVPLSSPRGANEVERLGDLVGPAARVGNLVCARSFQQGVACADADRGVIQWSRNLGGWQAVGADDQVVVAADASDRVSGWRTLTGESIWTSDRFLHRQLSGVAVSGRVAILGDAQGQVHFLDKLNGQPMLRMPTDGSPIAGSPLLAGTTVIVFTRRGGVFAFRPE